MRLIRGPLLYGTLAVVGLAGAFPGVAQAARTPSPSRVVIRASDVPGYSFDSISIDLHIGIYETCFEQNALLRSAPPVGIAGTGIAYSNRHATLGQSFTEGALVLNQLDDVFSIAWLAKSDRQAKGAFSALTSARFVSCMEKNFTSTDSGLDTPATVTAGPLSAPRVRGQSAAEQLYETVFDDPAGVVGTTAAFDLSYVRVGRMLSLLVTDAIVAGEPDALTPFPTTQRYALALRLAKRMGKQQGIRALP